MSTPSDTPEIRPALTAEEWERTNPYRRAGRQQGATAGADPIPDGRLIDLCHDPEILSALLEGMGKEHSEKLHALAALCLHGQPFGFTWEDVDALRNWADAEEESRADGAMSSSGVGPGVARSIANRIASLLPPQKDTP